MPDDAGISTEIEERRGAYPSVRDRSCDDEIGGKDKSGGIKPTDFWGQKMYLRMPMFTNSPIPIITESIELPP
jgi:hypothetical protein